MKKTIYILLLACIHLMLASCSKEDIDLTKKENSIHKNTLASLAVDNLASSSENDLIAGSSISRNESSGNAYSPGQVIIRFEEDYTEEEKIVIRAKYAEELDFDLNYIDKAIWDNRLELWKVSKDNGNSAIDVNDLVTSMKTKDFDEGDLDEVENFLVRQSEVPTFTPSTISSMEAHLGTDYLRKIAIIDSGLDYGLIDGNYFNTPANSTEPNEIAGWDFVDNDADVMDEFGHGTHIAKIIIDELQTANVPANIIPLRAFDDKGESTLFNLLEALSYVNANENIQVVNLSLGWEDETKYYKMLEDILNEVAESTLIISSSGNNGTNNDYDNYLPSNFNIENIISVGGFVKDDKKFEIIGTTVTGVDRATFSNYGRHEVDIAAPFSFKLNYPNTTYGAKIEGTSFSAAIVAARAAVVYEENTLFKRWKRVIFDSGHQSTTLNNSFRTGKAILKNAP